jgi:hypothetical protein
LRKSIISPSSFTSPHVADHNGPVLPPVPFGYGTAVASFVLVALKAAKTKGAEATLIDDILL